MSKEPLVVFEDPPPQEIIRGKWVAHLVVVKSRPLQWARIATGMTSKQASSLRTQLIRLRAYELLAAGGRFEVLARLMRDGTTGVWVRYHPPEGEAPAEQPEQPVIDDAPAVATATVVEPPAAAVDGEGEKEPLEPTPPRQEDPARPLSSPASVAAPRRQWSEKTRQIGDRLRENLSLIQRQHLIGLAKQWAGGEAFVVKVNVARALMAHGLIESSAEVRAALLAGHRDGENYPLTEVGEYLASRERGERT